MAVPMTSCMSLPIMATSVHSQRPSLTTLGYLVSQTSARWRPVTVPSLAASLCIMRPSRVAHIRTQRSLYSTTVPDWRSDSTLPGSNYAMDIRKPGTEKASFRKMNFKLVPASFE